MTFQLGEILESVSFVSQDHFDIRTVTMGLSLRECQGASDHLIANCVYDHIMRSAESLVPQVEKVSQRFNVPVANKRISLTPVALLCDGRSISTPVKIAKAIDRAANQLGLDFIGGYSAIVDRGISPGERNLIDSLPEALSITQRLCSSFNVATTRSGLNMDAISLIAKRMLELANATSKRDAIGCAKLVVFANAVEDNPFMAGAFHGISMGERCISVGISGPGVVAQALRDAGPELNLQELAETIKKTSFKMTRVGELFLQECSKALNAEKGIIDVSLAPTPLPGDSVGEVLELVGLERVGAHGTTLALALVNDAIKKGGMMAASRIGGMSGAFIPVSEDANMIQSAELGHLSLAKLEALTCVCSVGLDMIAIPGDIPISTLAAIIADEAALGMVNAKTTGVRIIPVPGKKAGEWARFGGLLGETPILPVSTLSSEGLFRRGGFVPTPCQGFRN